MLTDSNLSKREQLQGLRKDIDVKIEEAAKLAFENERLHAHYQGLSDKYSPKNIRVNISHILFYISICCNVTLSINNSFRRS